MKLFNNKKKKENIFSTLIHTFKSDFIAIEEPVKETKHFLKHLLKTNRYEAFTIAICHHAKYGKRNDITMLIVDILLGVRSRVILKQIMKDIIEREKKRKRNLIFRFMERFHIS